MLARIQFFFFFFFFGGGGGGLGSRSSFREGPTKFHHFKTHKGVRTLSPSGSSHEIFFFFPMRSGQLVLKQGKRSPRVNKSNPKFARNI